MAGRGSTSTVFEHGLREDSPDASDHPELRTGLGGLPSQRRSVHLEEDSSARGSESLDDDDARSGDVRSDIAETVTGRAAASRRPIGEDTQRPAQLPGSPEKTDPAVGSLGERPDRGLGRLGGEHGPRREGGGELRRGRIACELPGTTPGRHGRITGAEDVGRQPPKGPVQGLGVEEPPAGWDERTWLSREVGEGFRRLEGYLVEPSLGAPGDEAEPLDRVHGAQGNGLVRR